MSISSKKWRHFKNWSTFNFCFLSIYYSKLMNVSSPYHKPTWHNFHEVHVLIIRVSTVSLKSSYHIINIPRIPIQIQIKHVVFFHQNLSPKHSSLQSQTDCTNTTSQRGANLNRFMLVKRIPTAKVRKSYPSTWLEKWTATKWWHYPE